MLFPIEECARLEQVRGGADRLYTRAFARVAVIETQQKELESA